MPPKKSSSGVRPPRRTPRATARNSTTPVSANSTTKSPPTADDPTPHQTPPPSTDTISSPKPATAKSSPKTQTPLKSPPETTKTSCSKSIGDDFAGAEDVVHGETASKSDSEPLPATVSGETTCGIGDNSNGEVGVDETLVEKVSEAPENLAESSKGDEGGGTKRTVVKKTVRVVKKIVKKRVLKRSVQNRDGSGVEKPENLETTNDVCERATTVGESVSKEEETTDSKGANSMEVDSSEVNVTTSMEANNGSVELVKCSSNGVVSIGVEKEEVEIGGDNKGGLPEDQGLDSVKDGEEEAEQETDVSVAATKLQDQSVVEAEDENMDEVENQVLAYVEDGKEGAETQMEVPEAETKLQDQNVVSVGDQNVDAVENSNVEMVKDQNKGKAIAQNDECKDLNSNLDDGKGEDEVKEVGNNEVFGSKTELKLSWEMEALERRRRRKTEIFIGGLDKDAKEEDIRKVFEEVGEVAEVRLFMNGTTGKNKGFAFLRYASADDAKKALTRYHTVEIRGKQCGTSLVEGNDTIFLGNIYRKWKREDVIKLLQENGIDKIDEVIVMDDPKNHESNRGFAILEFETCKCAEIAYNKLQKKDVFGKHQKIRVKWADPLIEPDEEEILKVKTVYAEYIPSSWDEEKVKDYFKKYGEVENVVLAKNLKSTRRKDFAFVNYTSREAALACIEAFNRGQLNDVASEVNVKVALAKPMPKGKQARHAAKPTSNVFSRDKRKANEPVIKSHEPIKKGRYTSSSKDDGIDRLSYENAELVRLLREQASARQAQSGFIGSREPNYPHGMKQQHMQGGVPPYSNPREHPQMRYESSYPVPRPSALPRGVGSSSLPYHHQQGAGYTSAFRSAEDYPSYYQTRDRPLYHGSSGPSAYRRY